MAAISEYVEQYRSGLEKFLHDPSHKTTHYFALLEEKTGVKRFYIALGIFGIIAVYLVFGYGAQLLCNAIGFAYPAYASVKAIESSDQRDDTKWLTYWVVYAYLSTIEFFSDILLSWFPFYWLAKCILLIWCFAPVSWNGSVVIYERFIRPFFVKHQARIDSALADVANNAGNLLNKTVQKATQVVTDNALKKD